MYETANLCRCLLAQLLHPYKASPYDSKVKPPKLQEITLAMHHDKHHASDAITVHKQDLQKVLQAQAQAYSEKGIPSLRQRLATLNTLSDLLSAHQCAIADAISKDFGHRALQETQLAELYLCIDGIRYVRRRLKTWMRPQKRSVSLWLLGAQNTVIPQPLGVVGIIVPWNYPLFLCISPLIGAIAAGNRCMIKMATNSSHLSLLMQDLFAQNFPADLLSIVHGANGSEFSALPFDHLIFTGSSHTGHQIMRVAADNLTPVTLELGG